MLAYSFVHQINKRVEDRPELRCEKNSPLSSGRPYLLKPPSTLRIAALAFYEQTIYEDDHFSLPPQPH